MRKCIGIPNTCTSIKDERVAALVKWARVALPLLGLWLATSESHAGAVQIERIAVTVSDLDRTEAFYRDGLGFTTVTRQSVDDPATENLLGVAQSIDSLTMALGREQVQFIHYRKAGRDYPRGSRSPDLWFQHFAVVVADMDAAYARLQHVHFNPISTDGPQTLPKEDGGVRAFKFRDPDGHPLELLYFPAGQGRTVWHDANGGLIDLGIDHTAISVSETPASVAFYSTLLGLSVAYRVTNHGPAQQRLDGIRRAKVRITGLRPSSQDGPGIELLDYRSPPRGRPFPPHTRGSDLWHVHVVLRVEMLDELVATLRHRKVRFVSPGIVRLASGKRAVEVADPDGHDLVLEE